jgi:pilus assembly protein CpaB
MRLGSLMLVVAGVSVAGGSVYVAREYLAMTQGAAVAAPESSTIDVLIANQDIEFGAEIEPQMLAFQAWPRDAVPPGAFTQVSAVTGDEQTEPRRARTKLYKGEVLLAPKLSNFGEKVTIVQKLGTNTRAMAIKVNAETAVGGFVTPGDFVDILMTTRGGDDGMQVVTILQNIRVIGIDQQAEDNADQPEVARTITVEVSPADGQKLALAQTAGTLSLTLRTKDGVIDAPLDMIGMRDLLQEKSPTEEAAKKPVVVVRRGVETSEETVN